MDRRINRILSLLLFVLIVLISSGFTGSLQEIDETEDAFIRITQVDTSNFPEVTVYVTVVDINGEPVGVDPARIQLVENGDQIPAQQIEGTGEVQSFSAMLAIDVSGSMWADGKLDAAKPGSLSRDLAPVAKRQEYILKELISLLGDLARSAEESRVKKDDKPAEDTTPTITAEDAARDLKDDVNDFIKAQERIIDRTRALLDETPEDLTEEEEEILGELAREEAEWARFLRRAR